MAVPSRRAATGAGLFACSVMLAGCTNTASTAIPNPVSHYQQPVRFDDIYHNRSPDVVRYDRYTLVSTRPAAAQRDPLNQIVDITMPAQLVSSVGEGFRYLLLESGYSLCSATSSAFSALLSRPLPAVQRDIGPLKLSEALQVLAGLAWRLKVDEVNREVCFELRDQYRSFSAPAQIITSPTPRGVPVTRTSGTSASLPVPSTAAVVASSTAPRSPITGEALNASAATKKSALRPQSLAVPSPALTADKLPVLQSASGAAAANIRPTSVLAPAVGIPEKTAPASMVRSSAAQLTTVNPFSSHLVRPVTTLPPPLPVGSHVSPLSPTGAPVTVPPVGQTWRAEPGSTLKETLTIWASKANCSNGGNWVVIWPVTLDYRIDAPLVFHGNFESVLVQVFGLYRKAEKPLFAEANRIQCLISVSDTPTGGDH